MCNSRSMLMNFHFLSTINWKSLLWPQKSNSLTTTLHVHYAFISVSLLSLHDYDMNFNTEKFANIWWFERDGISVIKFKAALMYFLSGVIVAVAVVVAYSSLFFEWGRERKITSCCLQSLIGQLSFLLVPTMVQLYSVHAKRNEHWTKQTLWELHISTPHEFLTAANSWCGPTNESIVQKWINEIQSTPDNSNLEGKSKKKFELLGVRSK